MVFVFSIFATLSMLFFKQFGVGLAAAILIDATIVRGGAPARVDEAARGVELVPALVAPVAAPARAGGRAGAGAAGGPVRLDPSSIPGPLWRAGDPTSQMTERNLVMNASAKQRTGRNGASRRAFTPARIVALVVIGLVVLGLGYLHVSSGDDAVSVPSGAKAGDLILEDCHYATEQGNYAADCGTLVVPENRHKAGSRLIALPVTRIRARSADPAEPIFRLQGGPGITNMDFPAASRFADKHDVVLVGYRGVEGSSRLDCPEVTSAREQARGLLTEKAMRADAAAFKDCAERLQDDGVDLAGYTLPQRVDDLDAARRALGYERVDLLSESAGTRTAMIYAWRYPQRIHRSVMIGVNPPGNFLWDAKTTGEQIERYAALCAMTPSCRSPHAGPRGLDPLGVRPHARPLVVPADPDGQRQARLRSSA